jgi:hypothetical protein
MSEKIFLTYTNATAVPYQGTELGHHIVLNYIDSNGVHHTLQASNEPMRYVPEDGRPIQKFLATSGKSPAQCHPRNN